MTVISEGLLINSNCIKMGREKEGGGGGVQAFLTQPPLEIVCHWFNGYPFTNVATVNKKSLGARRFGL